MTNSVSCDYDFFKNAPKFAKCHFFNLSGKGVWSSSSPYSLNAKRETMTHVRKSSLSGFNIPGPLSEKEVVDSVVWREDVEKECDVASISVSSNYDVFKGVPNFDMFKGAPEFTKVHFFNLSGHGLWASDAPILLNGKKVTGVHIRKWRESGFNIPVELSDKEVMDSVVWRKDAEKPAESSGTVPVGSQNGALDKAIGLLGAAKGHMEDRASTYDAPQGECSMGATVEAFNAMTGHQLTEEQGWMFMETLKMVRSQQGGYRPDNYEDAVAYAAFRGAAAAQRDKK